MRSARRQPLLRSILCPCRLAGWLAGRLAGWLAGRLAGKHLKESKLPVAFALIWKPSKIGLVLIVFALLLLVVILVVVVVIVVLVLVLIVVFSTVTYISAMEHIVGVHQ